MFHRDKIATDIYNMKLLSLTWFSVSRELMTYFTFEGLSAVII